MTATKKLSRAAPPDPRQIRSAREAAGLTQTQAAILVRGTLRAWQNWEAGERRMHPGLWELFLYKIGRTSLLSR